MARRRAEPVWLNRTVIDAIHQEQVREHGGRPGSRDENAVESAIARPRQRWQYSVQPDLPALAASYAFGLVRNHPYRDGNTRVGFLAMVTFLGINGHDFTAAETDVVTEILGLASGQVSEGALADWIRGHTSK